MVAIITGKGTGLERSSAWILGSRGQSGSAQLGRDGGGVYVNAANGNLVITRQDEFLIGLGANISADRTYNSQATISDGDNGDNWRESAYRKVTNLTGDYGSAGSTVKRIDWDGSETLYTWNATFIDSTHGAYVATDGVGAYDMMTRASGIWTWTDGDTQSIETYDENSTYAGRITSAVDTDGNTVEYNYASGTNLISQIKSKNVVSGTAHDETVRFFYDDSAHPNCLTRLETWTEASGSAPTLTRVRYAYDSAHRLSTVTVDLSPGDNTVGTGSTHITTYTYADSTSTRVASIGQSDGSLLQITYALSDGVYRVSALSQTSASGVYRGTSFDYTIPGQTTVTDAASQKTVFFYDTNGNLTAISYPPESASVPPRVTQFAYNGNGDVISVAHGPGNVVSYEYDSHGNVTKERDSAGNTIARTYSAKNELLTETRYLVPDPDGAGSGQPATPLTARYAYDGESHLRYIVSAEGFVTQFEYDTPGRRTAANEYAGNAYNLAGIAENVSIAEATLTSFVSALDKTTAMRTETTYDYRGSIYKVTSWSKVQSSGLFDTGAGSEKTETTYVYDQAGNLLSRVVLGPSSTTATETFAYDGLNRLASSTDFNGITTTIAFDNSPLTTVVSLSNGLTRTSTYNLAGELISYAESGSDFATATTQFRYDNLGRLRITIDPTGQKSFIMYDTVGRPTAS